MSSGLPERQQDKASNGQHSYQTGVLPATVADQCALLSAIFAQSPDGMAFLDADLVIRAANASYAEQIGVPLEQLIGHMIERFLPGWLTRTERVYRKVRETGQPFRAKEFPLPVANRPGAIVYRDLSISPVYSSDGAFLGYLLAHRDATEQKLAHDASDFLAETGKMHGASLDYEVVLQNMARLAVPFLADWCVIYMLDNRSIRRLAVAASDTAKGELLSQLSQRYPIDLKSTHVASLAIATGQTQLLSEVSDSFMTALARDTKHLQMLHDLGGRSAIGAPLIARGQVIGAIYLGSLTPGRYTPRDVDLVEEVARRAAMAIDNARLYRSEQKARARAERFAERIASLHSVIAGISQAFTPAEAADVIINRGITILGAAAGSVALLNRDGTYLEVIRAIGYREELAEQWGRFPIDAPVPLAEVARTGENIFLESQMAFATRFPLVALEVVQSENQSFAAIPLTVKGRIIGGIGMSFPEPRDFDQEDRSLMISLAQQCALALERTRLYQAEQKARANAERLLKTTERLARTARERAAELEAILDSMIDGILVTDARGRTILANETLARLLGLRGPAQVPRSLTELHNFARLRYPDGRHIPPEETATSRALAGETVARFEHMIYNRQLQRDLHLLVSATPIKDGKGRIHGAVAVIRDVTQLHELDRLKDQFISVAAHELKTPIAIMKGYAQALLRTSPDIPSTSHKMLDAIDRGADRINRVVNELLDVSRLYEGRLDLAVERIDLFELLEEVVDHFSVNATKHCLRVSEADPMVVQGDRDRLAQVLANLVDNAIRYSPQGGDVEVAISAVGQEVVVSVRDQGVGIPRDKQEHIFERFYRAHTGTPYDYGGMGVGLYISREIVLRHGGRMWFEGAEGEGSAFYFALPLGETSTTPSLK